MLRRLFTLLAAISLLLLLPEVALWVRGYWIYDSITHDRSIALERDGQITHHFELFSSRGSVGIEDFFLYYNRQRSGSYPPPTNSVSFVWEHGTPSTPGYTADLAHLTKYQGTPSTESEHHALGITVLYRDQRLDKLETDHWFDFRFHHRHVYVEVPWLAFLLPTSLLPALWIYRRWKRRRLTAGVKLPCSQCGYSLVGNRSGVCPECGTTIVTKQQPARFTPRYAFPAFALFCFLFSILATALWVRSYWNADGVHLSNTPTFQFNALREITISVCRGALLIEGNATDPTPNPFSGENAVFLDFKFEQFIVEPLAYPSVNYQERAKSLAVSGTSKLTHLSFAGFGFGHLVADTLQSGGRIEVAGVVIPLPAIALAAAMPAAFWVYRRKKRKRNTIPLGSHAVHTVERCR